MQKKLTHISHYLEIRKQKKSIKIRVNYGRFIGCD